MTEAPTIRSRARAPVVDPVTEAAVVTRQWTCPKKSSLTRLPEQRSIGHVRQALRSVRRQEGSLRDWRRHRTTSARPTASTSSSARPREVPVPAYPTDIFTLDMGLHGGVPQFLLSMIYGWESSGKALSLDTPIPTPSGWSTMGRSQSRRPGPRRARQTVQRHLCH